MQDYALQCNAHSATEWFVQGGLLNRLCLPRGGPRSTGGQKVNKPVCFTYLYALLKVLLHTFQEPNQNAKGLSDGLCGWSDETRGGLDNFAARLAVPML